MHVIIFAVQVRRMQVNKIWDKSNSSLSIQKLLTKAAVFADLENSGDGAWGIYVANPTTTYIDEDGDEVNVSFDEELNDAFLQSLAVLPVRKPLVFKVTFPKKD